MGEETIGLMAAMDSESRALLRLVKRKERIPLGGQPAVRFELAGRVCLLVTSGMGLRRARQAAEALLEAVSLRMLISFGIAGALEGELAIGDVVLPGSTCLLEGGECGARVPLALWSATARQAMTRSLLPRGVQLTSGTAVTTHGSQLIEASALEHPILEMETFGIAQACAAGRVPLLAVRAISDGPGAPIPVDLGEMMDEDANLRLGQLMRALVRQPALLFGFRRMMRNSRRAAENAALALAAALRLPSVELLGNPTPAGELSMASDH